MTIVLQIFPNGEFSHGVDSSHRRHRNPRPQTSPPHELIPVGDSVCLQGGDICGQVFPETISAVEGDTFRHEGNECTYTYLCADMGKHLYAIEYDFGLVTVNTLYDSLLNCIKSGALVPIGLSTARNLKKTLETRRTPLTMTKRMARRIRNAGYLLQQEYGKDNLSFLTLTLPSVSMDDLYKLAINWGAMVHKFLVWLRYRVGKFKMPLRYVCCTEIQTKRLEQRNEFVPHLHLLFRGRYGKKSAWAITPLMARKEWARCIRSVLNHTNFDKRALENLQRVRKNAAGYISKYMSKGACSLPPPSDGFDWSQFSTDWGSMDRQTSQSINRSIVVLRGDAQDGRVAWCIVRAIPYFLESGIISFYKAGFIELSPPQGDIAGRGLRVGVGRFAIPIDEDSLLFLGQSAIEYCHLNVTNQDEILTMISRTS